MKKCLAIAVLLLASSLTTAQAQVTFEYGGRTITIDPDRGTIVAKLTCRACMLEQAATLTAACSQSACPLRWLITYIPPRFNRYLVRSLSASIARPGAMQSISPRVKPISISSRSFRSWRLTCDRSRLCKSALQY